MKKALATIRSFVLLLLVSLCAMPAHSQGAAAPKKSGSKVPVIWKQEPTSFIDIALDQPLTSSVKQCPEGRSYAELCMSSRYSAEHPVKVCCVQIAPFESTAYVSTSDWTQEGKVGVIALSFESARFRQVSEMLTVRYGKPHKQNVSKVKTKGGAEFDSVEFSWVGTNVRIVATSLADRFFSESQGRIVELGTVVVSTEAYARAEAAKVEEAAKRGAGKL